MISFQKNISDIGHILQLCRKKEDHWKSIKCMVSVCLLALTKAIHSQSGSSFVRVAHNDGISIVNEERQELSSLTMLIPSLCAGPTKDDPDWE